MMQTQNAFNLKYANCRRNSATARTISDTASDIADADYVDRNIPKMELLKINYVNKSLGNLTAIGDDDDEAAKTSLLSTTAPLRERRRSHQKAPAPPRPRSEGALKVSELAKLSNATAAVAAANAANQMASSGHRSLGPLTPSSASASSTQHNHPLKYTVYKKHNDASGSRGATKLQYTNNDDVFKSKKKYLMFDSKKRNANDNIQFFFDSKSYERHVDNKMYGVLTNGHGHNHTNAGGDAASTRTTISDAASTGSSHSWNFIKSAKAAVGSAGVKAAIEQKIAKKVPLTRGESKTPTASMQREKSLIDLARIAKNFRENRSASSDSILTPKSLNKLQHRARDDDALHRQVKKSEKTTMVAEEKNRCLCQHNKPAEPKARPDAMPNKVKEVKKRPPPPPVSNNQHHSHHMHNLQRVEPQRPSLARSVSVDTQTDDLPLHDQQHAEMADCKITADLDKSIVNIEYGCGTAPKPTNPNKNTCGYKNCTFVNCPMSSGGAGLMPVSTVSTGTTTMKSFNNMNNDSDAASLDAALAARRKTIHSISITKIDTISNKSKLYLKTKEFNLDDNGNCIDEEEARDLAPVALNNMRNIVGGNKKKMAPQPPSAATTIPIKFMPNNQNLNNSIKCKSVDKANFISSSTSMENRKFNNLSAAPLSLPAFNLSSMAQHAQISITNNSNTTMAAINNTNHTNINCNNKPNDSNRVKIFIRNPPSISSSTSSTSSGASSRASSSSDSCSSDYYDRVADSGILLNDHTADSSSNSSDVANNKMSSHLRDLFPTRLGCDGAIFWNDCYYYDEHACCDCRSPGSDGNAKDAGSAVTVLCSCDAASSNGSATSSNIAIKQVKTCKRCGVI